MSAEPRIVVRRSSLSGDWSASFADKPQVAFGGETYVTALGRLLAAQGIVTSEFELVPDRLKSDLEAGYVEVVVRRRASTVPCPDCGGTGEYVGLHSVEVCRGCHGRHVTGAD